MSTMKTNGFAGSPLIEQAVQFISNFRDSSAQDALPGNKDNPKALFSALIGYISPGFRKKPLSDTDGTFAQGVVLFKITRSLGRQKRFAQEALGSVSLDGAANLPAGHHRPGEVISW